MWTISTFVSTLIMSLVTCLYVHLFLSIVFSSLLKTLINSLSHHPLICLLIISICKLFIMQIVTFIVFISNSISKHLELVLILCPIEKFINHALTTCKWVKITSFSTYHELTNIFFSQLNSWKGTMTLILKNVLFMCALLYWKFVSIYFLKMCVILCTHLELLSIYAFLVFVNSLE